MPAPHPRLVVLLLFNQGLDKESEQSSLSPPLFHLSVLPTCLFVYG